MAVIAVFSILCISAKIPFEASHKSADVNIYEGVSVFTDCNPIMPYDIFGEVVVKSTGGFGNDTYNSKRQSAITKMKKQYPTADGILISFTENGGVHATAIKFK